MPAFAISTKASTYISVCTLKSFKSDSAIKEPTALGMPPIPNCRQAPFGISFTINSATFLSTSVAGPPAPNSAIGALSPSTIISTSEICTPFSNPPRQTGMFLFTSTITTLDRSTAAAK